MKIRMMVLVLATLVACQGVGPQTAQMANLAVSTAPMPITTPIQRPLVLVVSETAVAPDVTIENTPHSITGFDAFVAASLQQALANQFTSVTVVTSSSEAPAEPHFVAEYVVTGVWGKHLEVEGTTETALIMAWSFALRPSESQDYVFTASGEGVSDTGYATLDEGVRQMMTSALDLLHQIWTEKNVTDLLRAIEPPAADN
jgi:hypothetical protein